MVNNLRKTDCIVTILVALVAGCSSTTVIDAHVTKPALIDSQDAVVVLGRRSSIEQEIERDFIKCVGKNLSKHAENFYVVPEETFVDGMYPYFENSTAPLDIRDLGKLVKIPEVIQKLQEFKVRYFIWIVGFTERTDENGAMSCAVAPGGGGCFGFATWSDEASYEAHIWDLENLQITAKVSAETQGTSYMPAIFVPIPLLARVQSSACQGMAKQIQTVFR
ncbi:MAG TPA: hypothetical protein QF499_04175 [Gammaproteobacteria bacterium]|jgi:hypothetical protein|nr:hypothetical protein [Gammaproteobacteria bacterium]